MRLERGVNILAAGGSATWLNRFSEYTLLGQQAGNDELNADEAAHVIATAQGCRCDPPQAPDDHRRAVPWTTTRPRPASTGRRTCGPRRARSAAVTVQGWRETPDGDLWAPGRLVHITDDWLGLDRELLIVSTAQQISSRGELTTLAAHAP